MQKVFIKWIRNAATMLAVTLIGASTGLAQVSVDLSQLVGRPGETGVVAVSISNVESGTAIESYGFDVETTGGITFTGIDDTNALTGDAGFNSDTGLPGNARVGGFAQGTNISTSGTFIYLTFDLDASGAGTITLANFLFNSGDPAVANVPPTGDYVVSDRMLKVEDHLQLPEEGVVHEGDEFTIKVFVEDAFEVADDVVSFSMEVNYDPTVFTIDKSRGAAGVITSGTMNSTSVVNANDVGGANSGVYLVAGFVTSDPLVGSGVLFELAALAGSAPAFDTAGETTVYLTDVMFNTGAPLYGAFPGTTIVYPFNVATEENSETPETFVLDGNYPNPFNPTTNIQFDLPESATVSIQIMDLLGRQVMSVPAETFSAGLNHTISINAGNLTSGLYLYRVVAQGQSKTSVQVGSMTLLK